MHIESRTQNIENIIFEEENLEKENCSLATKKFNSKISYIKKKEKNLYILQGKLGS
jgi:hypothetical protein